MTETMTLDQKLDITLRAIAMKKVGDKEGGSRLLRTAPLPPYLAKVMKETMGVDFVMKSGWNLSEAEAEFGGNWLSN